MKDIDKLPYLIIDKNENMYQLQIVGVEEGYRIVYINNCKVIYTKPNNNYKNIDKLDIIHYDLETSIKLMLAKLKEYSDDLQYRYSHPQNCTYKSQFNSSSDD